MLCPEGLRLPDCTQVRASSLAKVSAAFRRAWPRDGKCQGRGPYRRTQRTRCCQQRQLLLAGSIFAASAPPGGSRRILRKLLSQREIARQPATACILHLEKLRWTETTTIVEPITALPGYQVILSKESKMQATNPGNANTVVGVFEDRQKAQQAVNELKQAGFREDQIGIVGI